MRLVARSRVITLVIAGALLAINVMALRWSSNLLSFKRPPTLLRYGDRVSTMKGKRLESGQAVALATKNPASLVLYFSSTPPPGFSTELVKYAETLSQRHRKDGLEIAVIVQQEVPDLKTLLDRELVTYDVLVDETREIQDQLGLNSGESGVFVFDREGVCRFSTRHPVSAGDLRQLVAMEFLKVDPLRIPPEPDDILKVGKSLGSFSLLDARSLSATQMQEVRSKAGLPRHFVFFTADCSVCSLPKYLEEFRAFQTNRPEGDTNAVLIFDFNFPTADVLEQLRINDVRTPSYLAKEPLPKLEFTDQKYRHLERTVAVIQTDAQRTVLRIDPLNSPGPQRNSSAVSVDKRQSQPENAEVAYEEMFNQIPFAAYDVATYQGKYFLTDFEGNRLIVIKDNMEVERDFGRIGSSPGRLFHPGYLDIGSDGTIFVQDGGNERIAKFDQSGNFPGDFRVADYQGLAVGRQNELYLGQPEGGHLITVYSSFGKKLRSFGQLKKFSEIYGKTSRDKDEPYKIAFNRVRLSTDRDGNIYVSFMLTPLIQKYSPDGTLLFERRLEAPEIDFLMEAIQQRKYIATKSDQVDARILALDPVVDPASGNIMVPLVDGWIYIADPQGHKLSLFRPAWINRGDGTFYPFVAGLGAKGELMVTPFPPKRWYRLTMGNRKSYSTTAPSEKESTVATKVNSG